MWTPCYSVKRTDSLVPLVPGLHKIHWIMQSLACPSRKVVCHCWSIQQLDITIALVCTVQPLVSLSRKRTARESSRMRLCSAQQHGYTLPCLPEIYQKPPKYGQLCNADTQCWSHDVRNRGVPLYIMTTPAKDCCVQFCMTLSHTSCVLSCSLFYFISGLFANTGGIVISCDSVVINVRQGTEGGGT